MSRARATSPPRGKELRLDLDLVPKGPHHRDALQYLER
jgi:hypothetical protein